MTKTYRRSEELIRRQVKLPATIGKLLQAAGVEHRAPEDVGGLLFGCLAHLSANIWQQFPDHWPMFRQAFIEATDELRDVLMSADPAGEVAEIVSKQRRIRESMESATSVGAVDPAISDAEVIAAIRAELWDAMRGRDIGGDRTLLGMVKRLRAERDKARENRRGEFDLRMAAEEVLRRLRILSPATVEAVVGDIAAERIAETGAPATARPQGTTKNDEVASTGEPDVASTVAVPQSPTEKA